MTRNEDARISFHFNMRPSAHVLARCVHEIIDTHPVPDPCCSPSKWLSSHAMTYMYFMRMLTMFMQSNGLKTR